MSLFASIALAVQRVFLGFEPAGRNAQHDLPEHLQPVFIIGAPRSGSTLLFQLLVTHFRVAYISNLMALFPSRMSWIAARTRKQMTALTEVRESELGYVPGLHAPNEAGAIMRLWFADPLDEKRRHYVRGSVARLSRLFDAPVVFKNLNNSLRIDHIREVFPKARFLYLSREAVYNAQSILRARQQLGLGQHEWWSVEPPGFEDMLAKPAAGQVAWQVSEIARLSGRALESVTAVHRITYEQLVEAPDDTLGKLAAALGLEAKSRSADFEPLSGKPNRQQLPDAEWEELLRFCEQYPVPDSGS